jgi:hypothetical protein
MATRNATAAGVQQAAGTQGNVDPEPPELAQRARTRRGGRVPRQEGQQANPPQQGGGGDPGNLGGGGDGGGDDGGGGENLPPVVQPPAPPNVPIPFSLTPGTNTRGIIDYSKKIGETHYKGATAKVEEELYDCNPDGFFQFIKSLAARAEEYGWSAPGGILWIPLEDKPGSPLVNVLEDYGRFKLKRIQQYEATYINDKTRAAQDDRLFYECILNSLTIQGKAKLNIQQSQYMVGNPELPSGLCYFKVLVGESYLDSNATSGMIRTKLSNLDGYIGQVGNDIVKFNNYVQTLLDALTARGENTTDLLTNLFKGYAACSDKNFVKYIGDKQSDWEEGNDLSPQQLMNLAANKFKILKTKEIWEAPSDEEEKLIALQARLEELKKKFGAKRKSSEQGGGKSNKKLGGHSKGKSKKQRMEKPEWMSKAPNEKDLQQPKEWNNIKWYYCCHKTGGKCDGVWRAHKPSDCKGTARKTGKGGTNSPKERKFEKKVVINEAVEEIAGGYNSE